MSEAKDNDNQPSPNDSSPQSAQPDDAANAPKSKKSQNKASAASSASSAASPDNALTTTQKTKKTGKTPNTADSAKKPARSRRSIAIVVIVVVLLILMAGIGGTSYWVYEQNQQLKQSLVSFSSQQTQQGNNLGALQTQLETLNQQQQTLDGKTAQTQKAQLTAKLTIEQVSAQLQTMASEKGKDPLLWRLSEVDYLLSIANHRLLLERDVNTAKVALQDADRRLKAMGDPALIPIREKISNEINKLNSVALPDIAGMAAQLSSLMTGIGQLPLVKKEMAFAGGTTEPADMEGASIGDGAKKLLNDVVSGLFDIQRTEQAIEPLLTPDEKQYLSQNLSLKLEQARIALLHRDTSVFRSNLTDIKQWVARYFDQNAASVANVLQTAQQLESIDLKPALPDISASLRELRAWIKHQQQTAHVDSDSSYSRLAPQQRAAPMVAKKSHTADHKADTNNGATKSNVTHRLESKDLARQNQPTGPAAAGVQSANSPDAVIKTATTTADQPQNEQVSR